MTLKTGVDRYFQLHGPVDEKFKEFTKLISIYLTFITGKSLHPSGIEFGGVPRGSYLLLHREEVIYKMSSSAFAGVV